jgi:hypothetical protein
MLECFAAETLVDIPVVIHLQYKLRVTLQCNKSAFSHILKSKRGKDGNISLCAIIYLEDGFFQIVHNQNIKLHKCVNGTNILQCEYCYKTLHENIIMLEQVRRSLRIIQLGDHLHSFPAKCHINNLNCIHNASITFSSNFTVDFLCSWCKCISLEDTGHIS